MKKILTTNFTKSHKLLMVVSIFIFSMSIVSVANATTPALTITPPATAQYNDHITIPLIGTNFIGAGIVGMQFNVLYNPTYLTYTGFTQDSAVGTVSVTPSSGNLLVLEFDLSNTPLALNNQSLLTLNFDVATNSVVTATINYDVNPSASDAASQPVSVDYNNGSVSLNPPAATAPSSPTSFATSSLTGTSVNFSWSAPSDGGSVITGYYFEKYDTVANATTSTLYASTTLATSTTGLISGRAYRFSVSAVNAIGTSSPSVLSQTMPTAPTAPTSFATSSAVVYNSAAFTWAAPSSNGGSAVTGYYFEVVTGGSTTTSALFSSATTATTTALSGSTAYTFYIYAVNIAGTSTPATISLTTPGAPTAPGAPSSFATTSIGYTNIDLSWAAPSSNGGSDVTGYYFEQFNGTATTSTLLSSGTLSRSSTGLTAGLGYRFTLSALNAIGTGTPAVLSATTTSPSAPTPPTSFATTSVSGTSVGLSWAAPSSSNGSAITGYYFEVFNGSATTSTLLSDVTTSTTTTGLTSGTAYRFTLSAVNGVGTSTVVVLNQTTLSAPGAPTSFATTSVTYTTIALSWAAPSSNGGSALTGYYFQQFNGSATTSTLLSSATVSTTTTGLTGGLGYRFTLSAVNAVGTSTVVVLNATTTAPSAPTPPTSFATTTLTGTSVAFTWGAPVDENGSAVTGYYFERYDSTTGTTSTLLSSATFSTTTTGLTNGRAYRFTLSAVNSLGTSTSVIINQTMPSVPNAPTSLATSTMTYSTALLTWTAPASNGADITDYLIEYSTGGATTTWTHTASAANSATVTGLSGSTSYVFAVSAINIAGTGAAAYVTGTTPATPPSVDISASSASVTTGGEVTISWTSSYASTCTTTMAGVDWQFSTTSTGVSSGALTSATTFTITCTGDGGSASDSVTVSLYQAGSSGGSSGYRRPIPQIFATSTINLFTKNLSLGMTDPDVRRLQQFLNSKGFIISATGLGSRGSESAYFGTKTKIALANFQRVNKITPASGFFGNITRVFVNGMLQSTNTFIPNLVATSTTLTPFNRSLTLGSTGADVKALQIFLNTHSFVVNSTGVGSPGNESSYFGPATQRALIRYQKAKGIVPAAGYFGPVTQAFIKNNQ